jgi:hypothetical protein
MGSQSSDHANTTQEITIRFASYIEDRHNVFLNDTYNYRVSAITTSPYANYETVDINDAFLGTGLTISSFPALYDMFGKYLSGLNIEDVWSKCFNDFFGRAETDEIIEAEKSIVEQDTIDALSAFQVAARNSNSVVSSSFIIGSALIESSRVKDLSNISLDFRESLIPGIQREFINSLNYNKNEVTLYAEFMKSYYIQKMEIDDLNTMIDAKNVLWPFTVLDFERAAIAALQGRGTYQKAYGERHRSTLSKALIVLNWTIQGALVGYYVGGPYGAVIGAVIGFIIGIGMLMLE